MTEAEKVAMIARFGFDRPQPIRELLAETLHAGRGDEPDWDCNCYLLTDRLLAAIGGVQAQREYGTEEAGLLFMDYQGLNWTSDPKWHVRERLMFSTSWMPEVSGPASNEYDDLEAWRRLAATLETYDGWALSMTSGNLHDLRPLFPGARVAAWVKPFAAFKRNVRIAYTWEPVLFVPGRDSSTLGAPVGRDHLAESITMRKGLTGAKPDMFNAWVLDLLGWVPGDDFTDLFPGTAGMSRVVASREGTPTIDQLEFAFADSGAAAVVPNPYIEHRERTVSADENNEQGGPIVVTVTDKETGEVLETRTLENDFMILCAGNRYVKGVQAYPGTGTQVVTVAVDR